ncbi:MAG: hypothetical protein HY939_03390 [Gammaproteobacteria bacterium]|nr:hypothetical protein [Gammaproteobacteria bacterium]
MSKTIGELRGEQREAMRLLAEIAARVEENLVVENEATQALEQAKSENADAEKITSLEEAVRLAAREKEVLVKRLGEANAAALAIEKELEEVVEEEKRMRDEFSSQLVDDLIRTTVERRADAAAAAEQAVDAGIVAQASTSVAANVLDEKTRKALSDMKGKLEAKMVELEDYRRGLLKESTADDIAWVALLMKWLVEQIRQLREVMGGQKIFGEDLLETSRGVLNTVEKFLGENAPLTRETNSIVDPLVIQQHIHSGELSEKAKISTETLVKAAADVGNEQNTRDRLIPLFESYRAKVDRLKHESGKGAESAEAYQAGFRMWQVPQGRGREANYKLAEEIIAALEDNTKNLKDIFSDEKLTAARQGIRAGIRQARGYGDEPLGQETKGIYSTELYKAIKLGRAAAKKIERVVKQEKEIASRVNAPRK